MRSSTSRRCWRRELNARPENALIHEGVALPTGNFHAAELGAALDCVRAAFAHSASLIAGRVSALLDPRMSGLHAVPGRRSGSRLGPHDARVHRPRRRRRGALAGHPDGGPERVGVARRRIARQPRRHRGDADRRACSHAMGVLVATELVVAMRALRMAGRTPAGAGVRALFEAAATDPVRRARGPRLRPGCGGRPRAAPTIKFRTRESSRADRSRLQSVAAIVGAAVPLLLV